MSAKGGFLTPLHLQDIDGEQFQLLTPLIYRAADKTLYAVPAGFVTDFASIPRGLWWRYPKSGKWNRAAVLHDYLYVAGTRSRDQADALFLEALEACDVHWWTRRVFYQAVRLGGWKKWGEYRRQAEGPDMEMNG